MVKMGWENGYCKDDGPKLASLREVGLGEVGTHQSPWGQ